MSITRHVLYTATYNSSSQSPVPSDHVAWQLPEKFSSSLFHWCHLHGAAWIFIIKLTFGSVSAAHVILWNVVFMALRFDWTARIYFWSNILEWAMFRADRPSSHTDVMWHSSECFFLHAYFVPWLWVTVALSETALWDRIALSDTVVWSHDDGWPWPVERCFTLSNLASDWSTHSHVMLNQSKLEIVTRPRVTLTYTFKITTLPSWDDLDMYIWDHNTTLRWPWHVASYSRRAPCSNVSACSRASVWTRDFWRNI